MRPFTLHRDIDETGVSGTGVVAEGVEFSDGTVALRWTSAWPTSVVFHERGMESVEAVHGHGGKTRIVWWQ
jgi:L-fucose isomerase-like protein